MASVTRLAQAREDEEERGGITTFQGYVIIRC